MVSDFHKLAVCACSVATLGVAFLALLAVSIGVTHAAEKRVALVIGNSTYQHAAPLSNPGNDARAIAAPLRRLGFEVIERINLDSSGFRNALRDYAVALRGAEVGLFFYAGHGLQVEGRNYLASIDARLESRTDLLFETMRLGDVLEVMETNVRTSLVFLDACRDNPLSKKLARSMGTRSAAVGRGLARVSAGSGTLIAYATSPGDVALDGKDDNSPFTAGLLEYIETPRFDITQMLRRVRGSVQVATNGKQVPWSNESLIGDFYFNSAPAAPPEPFPRGTP